MHYHYTTGLQFLLDHSHHEKDWQTYFRLLPMVTHNVLEQVTGISPSSSSSSCSYSNYSCNSSDMALSPRLASYPASALKKLEENQQQLWQLWRWKPPVKSSLQSRDDYFYNPCSTPHSIMNEFKKHLSVSKDLKFRTNDLRRLAKIEFQPLMSFVTQDDYDEHTDSMVRSYFIFKDGVVPLWEDEYNAFGGGWSLIWNHKDINNNNSHRQNSQKHYYNQHYHQEDVDHNWKKTSKEVWKQVINALTDPKMVKYIDELCGVGLTIRANKSYKITIWNRNAEDTITKLIIGQNIKTILGHDGPMFYYSHKSTLKNQYEKKKKVRRRINFLNQNGNENDFQQISSSLLINNQDLDDMAQNRPRSYSNIPRLDPKRSSGFGPQSRLQNTSQQQQTGWRRSSSMRSLTRTSSMSSSSNNIQHKVQMEHEHFKAPGCWPSSFLYNLQHNPRDSLAY